MPRSLLAVASILLLALGLPADSAMRGFTAEHAAAQRQLEARYDALLDAGNLRDWMRQMAAKPHHVGSPHGKANAEFVADRFRSWGYTVEIEEYHVLFPVPTERVLEMVAPERFTAGLLEPALPEDPSSSIQENRLPPYNAYSADGDVTAELVYVNYGVPDDYEVLERHGIDVAGKIVIARYGGSWRGIKPKVAAEHGAVGCILYSDPRDDGYFQGDVYPEGPYRMAHGAQRGSVLDMPTYPGDPLTPGYGATPEADRLDRSAAPTIMPIPVLPISYADAQPLLEAIGGPVAPAAWRGALPLTYHLGPGPARVRLKLAFDWRLAPAYNVIARMEGAELPDEWVLRGNHRDAWVFGAADPISGMVALMEEARAIGVLARDGPRPRRTVIYAAWDAEEPGLLGSTEWAEHHADELRRKAVAYINTDGNSRGFLNAGGSHTLETLVNEVARAVEDPQTGVTVAERARARARVGGDREAATRADLRLAPLGSGSDYTPFLQHLGIASLNVSYGGEGGGGSYHSAYDTFEHYTRFRDPGFAYGIALAKTAGRLTLRLANADVHPLAPAAFADNVATYVREVMELAETLRAETEQHNALVAAGAYGLAADPTEPYVPPEKKTPVPHLNFAPLQNALDRLEASAEAYEAALHAWHAGDVALTEAARSQLNAILLHLERTMTDPGGLPRRSWFRHQIYAPGYYTGYGVKTLPGVREAVEQRAFGEAAAEVTVAARTLEAVAAEVDRATALLRGG
ncbi:MAG: transferrin receptor-like dimerization domain-containing protein [Rhodothermales bacterium]|nr:transferrin receptor-like dimerization domain-containing protein [Rhodothermales bacterium]